MIASTSASFLPPDNDGKAAVVRLKRSYVKAIASPRPPAAAKRRRAVGERLVRRENTYITKMAANGLQHDSTSFYCTTFITTRRSAASRRRLRRCGFVRGGGWLPCFTFPHFSFSSFFLQVFLTPSLTNGRIGRRIMWSYTRVTSAGGAANLWLRPESAAFPASTSLRAEVERQEEP